MALIDLLLRSTLGNFRAPDVLNIGLFSKAKEVTDRGYRRAEVRKGAWAVRNDGSAEITVRFGPLQAAVEYDRAVLFNGQEVVEQVVFPSPSMVQPYTVIDFTFAPEFTRIPD